MNKCKFPHALSMFTALFVAAAAAGALLKASAVQTRSSAQVSSAVVPVSSAPATASIPQPPPMAAPPLPQGAEDLINPQTALKIERFDQGKVPFVMIEGGIAGSRRCLSRLGVLDFVKGSGASAGLNGTFFANASLNGTDNLLIGPSLCGDEVQITLGPYDKKPGLAGRPLVLLSADRTRIIPYDPKTMDDETALRMLMPGMTDGFLGGVWLVHTGTAATEKQIADSGVHDADDFRRRAFFGVMPDGRPVLGATTNVTSSTHLAEALKDAGLAEAVLLDSGFSTSLVYGDKILVTGHTAPGIPSRPVPHALVLFGKTTLVKTTVKPMAAPSGKSV